MDFFARSARDEFLAILPTASGEMSAEVVERLRQSSFDSPVPLSEQDSMPIELNFGWASFGEDGETASVLVRTARVRRDQEKYASGGRVLSFTKELVH